jgi:hypothetical protein
LSGPVVSAAPVPHQAWVAARRASIEAHAGGARVAALLGPPGIGKTFLLAELERHFRDAKYEVERVLHGDLLTGEEATHILLVDEADRLEPEALAGLARRERGFVLLAALPGFAARLEGLPVPIIRLGALEAGEVAGYVAARLKTMGLAADRFAVEALPALAQASGGVPRLLNTLIGSSAFTADMEGEARVSVRHVAAAAALRAEVALPPAAEIRVEAPPPAAVAAPRRRRRGLPWLGGALAVFVLGSAAWLHERGLPGLDAGAVPSEAASAGAPRPTEVLRQALSTAALPPPAPSPTATLPSAPLPRIVLTYPRRDTGAVERSAALAATLTHAGWLVGPPFPVSRGSAAPALRFFFQEDREAALAVAALVGPEAGTPKLGTIPPGTPLPRPGTIELALGSSPAPVARAGLAPIEAFHDPLPPVATALAPANGAAVPASGLLLRWSVPGGAAPGCCYVEVVSLPERGEAAGPPREVFAGYGERPDSQPLALGEPRAYAWRVITVSREGLRYASSPWTSFTLGGAAR